VNSGDGAAQPLTASSFPAIVKVTQVHPPPEALCEKGKPVVRRGRKA
jgi:hypothetical protein